MIIQYIAAGGILSAVAALVLWLQLIDHRETKRRSLLPPEERESLEADDASWSQKFGF